MKILHICKEIEEYEKRLSELSISDTGIIRQQIEIQLGERYNKLMSWCEMHDVEEIRNEMGYVRKKIKL